MATIRKRGNKWQAQVRRKGFGAMGRSFRLKADAETWARGMEAKADRQGLPPDPKVLRKITVGQLIQRYRDTVVSRKRACAVETVILNALLRQPFARKSLAEIQPEAFAAYRDRRLETVNPVTIRRELSLLQHAFDIARREWDMPLAENPIASVRKPKPGNPRDRRLKGDEYERLMQAAGECRNEQIAPLIAVAVETGMRRGEMLNMRWEDLDAERRTLRIPETKTGIPRTIPLSLTAARLLADRLRNGSDYVFPTTASAVQQAWKRLTRRAGLTDLHFHDLRHEAISRFFEKGLSVAEVALISGHRDYRQLFRYTHLRAEDVARKLS